MRHFKRKNNGIIETYQHRLDPDELEQILSYADEITQKEYNEIVKKIKEDYENSKTIEQKLNEIKSKFETNKNYLINSYEKLTALANLKNDNELIKELKEDFSEELIELEETYIKDLEELKDGN